MENFDCLICLSQAQNPSLCATCSKVFCEACLLTHFQRNSRACPHCRSCSVGLVANGFVKVKWLPDLLKSVAGSESLPKEDFCMTHPSKRMSIFCADCKVSSCIDCYKANHEDHRLETVELAHDRMRETYFNLLSTEIDTVTKLVDDFKDKNEKIAALKKEGERRIALVEKDLRQRLEREISALEDNLMASHSRLFTYMNTSTSLIKSIDTQLNGPVPNRFLNEIFHLEELTRLVNDAIGESRDVRSIVVPDSLRIEVPPLWPLRSPSAAHVPNDQPPKDDTSAAKADSSVAGDLPPPPIPLILLPSAPDPAPESAPDPAPDLPPPPIPPLILLPSALTANPTTKDDTSFNSVAPRSQATSNAKVAAAGNAPSPNFSSDLGETPLVLPDLSSSSSFDSESVCLHFESDFSWTE